MLPPGERRTLSDVTAGAQQIAEALRCGDALDDKTFDRLYPFSHRLRSWLHWTPLEVARRACNLLAPAPDTRVLDVGSGVGKVCIVGALTTAAQWCGIERDPTMVTLATAAATALAARATFRLGEMTAVDWTSFRAFYLFNPFAEILLASTEEPAVRQARYQESVAFVEAQLAATTPGTRVVTYHGFGGSLERSFDLTHREKMGEAELCLWIRRA